MMESSQVRKKLKMKDSRFVYLAIFVLVTFCIRAESREVSKVIAKVNDEVITSKDLDDYCRFLKYLNPTLSLTPNFRKEVLERLIENKLIVSCAKKENLEVPEGWLKEKLNEVTSSYSSYEDFEKSLIEEGLNLTMLKERLREQYLTQSVIEKYVRSQIEVTPGEITSYYNEHKEEFILPQSYSLWIAKSEEKSILEDLGKQIEDVGLESIDKEKYGLNRIEIEEADLKDEIKIVVTQLKEQEYKVKKIAGLYYLIYLEKAHAPSILGLEDVKEKIYSLLWQDKFRKAFQLWIAELREKAVIKIYE
jgi:parvulin-like peptidyl-prolyl isomerase